MGTLTQSSNTEVSDYATNRVSEKLESAFTTIRYFSPKSDDRKECLHENIVSLGCKKNTSRGVFPRYESQGEKTTFKNFVIS